ncbi:MAG: two-component hybrid sensor and regulator [Chloroflexi bacterium]|jgi:signal transduction histidine kinase|nr:two-component hybrid sensor and regulator [Chloroflexota bacterium]
MTATPFYLPITALSPVYDTTGEEKYSALLGKVNCLEQELKAAHSTEQQLARLCEQVSQENEQLNEFIASIAHEMNNPLQVASSFISYLLQERAGDISGTQHDYLTAATAGVKQAQVLLQDLLCDSQLGRLQLDVDLKPVDLRKVVRETFNQFSLLGQTSHTTLVGCNLEGPECMVLGAENRLQQILVNFLTNAFKFSPAGSQVIVELRQVEDNYRVEIIDQGPGIRLENQALIFERRFQVKDTAGIYRTGFGLGLSITRELVELQGGSSGVESEIGQGSRFWFSLPGIPGQP